jgi:3-oxoacyl-[acyl-carrier protein] reductase
MESMNIPARCYPDLAVRVAVVTGGSGGIGAETCLALARTGARVAVVGRDGTAIDAVTNEGTTAGSIVVGIIADCTDLHTLCAARTQVERELGPTDILVAFAGGSGDPVVTWEIPAERWHAVVETNLTATFLTIKEFLPGMVARQRGAVVTMASSAARLPSKASAAYAAAKAGVVMLTRHFANEVAPHGVRVNCVAPSAVKTAAERVQMSGSCEVYLRGLRRAYAFTLFAATLALVMGAPLPGWPARWAGRRAVGGAGGPAAPAAGQDDSTKLATEEHLP